MTVDARSLGFRDLAIGDAGWLIERHAVLYAEEEGFDASFEALVARILADFIDARDPAKERAWIAHDGSRRLGSVFCVNGAKPGEAKLRLFLVVPEARGMGLGRALLSRCIQFARDTGRNALSLWTHAEHEAACALYAKSGFRVVESRAVTSFGQALTEQEWRLDLRV